jgi:hypothetical protein
MAKSYLNDAKHHADKIRYFYDHAGANGHSQANHHYHKLGECYSKSSAKHLGEAPILHDMFIEAGKLMDIMKKREEGAPNTDEAVKPSTS